MNNEDEMFKPFTHKERASGSEQNKTSEKIESFAVVPVPENTSLTIPHHPRGEPSKTWEYRNAQGLLMFLNCRFETPEGKEHRPLTYRQFNKDGARRWAWGGLDAPRPLYGLEQLAKRPDAPVLLCEGEKTADAAQKIFPDYVAITSSGGANGADKSDWTPLAARRVIIWPDNDDAGRKYASTAAQLALKAGAAFVSIVEVLK